jgi:hypothetical protein
MDRSLAARIGAGRRRPGSPPLPDGVRGAAPLLRLQRAAGNRAVATLARAPTTSTSPPSAAAALTPTGVKPVGDGISTHGAIDRFARKAIWFYQSHGDADLASYGHYLVAAASTELAAVGCPGVQAITGSGLMGALGEFEADNWAIVINVDRLRGLNGATTVGELDPGDAAFFASVVYHEGRHAEQRFRASRLMAAGHEDDPLEEAEPDVVTAARKLALDRRTPARERTEAADWRDFMVGEDETYVSAVDSWRKDVVAAAVLARDVTRDDATDTRSQIARMLAGWAKEHGPGGYIRSHMASAVKRSRRTLITDIRRIDKALAAAQAALDDLMPHPGKDDFPPLYAALVELARSLSAAYLDQPTEHDAFIAGNAAYDACLRWLRSPRRPLPS